ncbi:hypothetical protein ILUMI_18800 [Ignelater luminosus]|uniref:CRAL-TRIO domain-containing protein n=1 Tax=Ignelater luminosus TaxID=2038154 RepID=A0A8K0CJ93_IGNLU|nr:hypothetical protein ILUMI_18800 [Ignelater luminosus]
MAPLPSDSELSPWRVILRFKNADPETATAVIVFRAFLMVLDMLTFSDDSFVINGQEIIVDLKGVPYAYVAQVPPTFLKKVINLAIHSYPSRIKSVYYVSVPAFIQAILNILLSLLPEKLKSRVHMFSEKETVNLHKFVPRSILPEEYGGDAGPFNELSSNSKA